jgi:Na+/H+ antiporter
MKNFEIVIFLMTILITLSAFADRIKLPYPILLVVVGLVIGFVPFLPNLDLNPETVLLVFLPPILYDAAGKSSWHDFRREIRAISALAFSLVFFTTTTVAVAAHYLVPGFSWPLAFVLGAVVSPPDAVAATGIIKGLGLSRNVITIIEGESLLNDASALIAYRYAIAAVGTGGFILWKAGLEFLWVSGGGVLAGIFIGYLLVVAHKKITNNPLVETSLTLLTPFVAYLAAETFHTSGILAVVTAGLFISWRSREVFSSETRLQTKVVWDTAIFLLNGIIFILIGLQLPAIVEDLRLTTIFELVGYGLIISAVTIFIRILWVFGGAYSQSIFRGGARSEEESDDSTKWKNVVIVAWTGTRGVVSLAIALALPLELARGVPFPKRHSIILLAFIVILVTLVLQGLTLPLLIRLLKIKPHTRLQKQEESELQLTMTENVLQFIQNDFPLQLDDNVMRQVRGQYELTHKLLTSATPSNRLKYEKSASANYFSQLISARLEVVKFQRELLIQYHKEGRFNDETINKAERELDIEELRLQTLIEKGLS